MSRLKTLLSTLPPLEMPVPHGMSLYAFALFPNLPPEIRDAIWILASREPRTIKLFFVDNYLEGWKDKMAVPGQTRHPGVVHACHESREAALKNYEICDSHGFIPQGGAVGFNTVYVNFSIDRFLFQIPPKPIWFLPRLQVSALNFAIRNFQRIQHIEISSNTKFGHSNAIVATLRLLQKHVDFASIRFTIFNIPPGHDHFWLSVDGALRFREVNRFLKSTATKRLNSQRGGAVPEVEVHWKIVGDTTVLGPAPAPAGIP